MVVVSTKDTSNSQATPSLAAQLHPTCSFLCSYLRSLLTFLLRLQMDKIGCNAMQMRELPRVRIHSRFSPIIRERSCASILSAFDVVASQAYVYLTPFTSQFHRVVPQGKPSIGLTHSAPNPRCVLPRSRLECCSSPCAGLGHMAEGCRNDNDLIPI